MSSIKYTELCTRIRFIRDKYGLSKADLARSLGVTASYISSIESGRKTELSTSLAKLLTWEFGVNTEWILTGKGPVVIKKERFQKLDEYEEQILFLLQGMDKDRKKKVLEMIEKENLLMTLLQKQRTIMTMVEERETEMNPLCEKNNHDV